MAQEHLNELLKARSSLVAARRGQAKVIALSGARSSEDAREFASIQAGIESIDRAIEDERALMREGT